MRLAVEEDLHAPIVGRPDLVPVLADIAFPAATLAVKGISDFLIRTLNLPCSVEKYDVSESLQNLANSQNCDSLLTFEKAFTKEAVGLGSCPVGLA